MDDDKKLSASTHSENQAATASGTATSAQQVQGQPNATYQILIALASPRENEFTRVSQTELFYERVLSHAGQYGDVDLINELRSLETLDGDPRKWQRLHSFSNVYFDSYKPGWAKITLLLD